MSTYTEIPSTFASLLHDIGKDLDDERVRYIKYLLQGHINKETLQHLGDSGPDLVEILQKRGLVSEKRLAFLRKLLVEVKCLKLVNLLDEFKEKLSPVVNFSGQGHKKGTNGKRNDKREALLRMMERLENEIRSMEDSETESSNEIKQFETQMETLQQRLASEEDEITKLKQQIKENQSKIESFERKLESVRFFLKKHEVDLDKIKQKLEESKNSANIKMELKEKMNEYETEKKGEDDLVSKYQKTLDDVRSIHVEIRHRTEEIIRLEDCIHDLVLQIRIVKHTVHKNHRIKMELQEKLDNTAVDLADTDRQKPMTPGWTSRSRSRLTAKSFSRADCIHPDNTLEYKVLDYNEFSGQESTIIGRKGKGISPPQFNLPVSVAVDVLGNLHVADYGNGRVHVIDTFEGAIERQPLNIGGKCRPCAVAVNYRGDLVMTDSQIIRVFNNKGEFLRPILPVYSKNDRRPHLCSVATDSSGSIYAGDRANHRIQKFAANGKFLQFIGSHEEINYPIGIAVNKHGDVIVSDYVKHQLKVFPREETLKPKKIGNEGLGACKFSYPRGIALDDQENILVADSQNHRIQVVSLEGEYVGSFGRIGDEAGCLNTPYDVTVDNNGSVIVADAKNHRVQVFVRLIPIYSMNNNESNFEIEEKNDSVIDYIAQNEEAKDEDYDASGSEDENSRVGPLDSTDNRKTTKHEDRQTIRDQDGVLNEKNGSDNERTNVNNEKNLS